METAKIRKWKNQNTEQTQQFLISKFRNFVLADNKVLNSVLIFSLLLLIPHTLLPLAKYAEEFLNLGLGARSYGMGGAFTSIADDATSLYWNPAGTAQLEKKTAFFMHSMQYKNLMTYDALTFTLPGISNDKTLSFGVLYLNIPDIWDTRNAWEDTNNDSIPDEFEIDYTKLTKFSDNEFAFYLNGAIKKTENLFLGFNVKFLRKSFAEYSANGLGTDLGLVYIPVQRVRLGVNLKDVTGSFLLWNTGNKEFIYPKMRTGITVIANFFFITESQVNFSMDAELRADHRLALSQISYKNINADIFWGMEYWFKNTVAVRIGADSGSISSGLGISYKGINLDYAILMNEQLDNSQRLSGSITF